MQFEPFLVRFSQDPSAEPDGGARSDEDGKQVLRRLITGTRETKVDRETTDDR